MGKGKDLFKKIIIDNAEVSIDTIDAANGKFNFATAGKHTVEYVLKENTNTIPESLFKNCDKLSYVSVPAQITTIENNAFSGTDLPDNVISYISYNYPNYHQKEKLNLSFSNSVAYFVYNTNLAVQEVNGIPTGSNLVAVYASNDTSKVDIDANNKLVWNSAGEATITATVGESAYYLSGTAKYKVIAKKETVQLEFIGFTIFNENDEYCKGQLIISEAEPITYENENYYQVYFNSDDNQNFFIGIGDPYFVKVNTNNIIGENGIEIYSKEIMGNQMSIVEGLTFNAYSLESINKEIVLGSNIFIHPAIPLAHEGILYSVTYGNEVILVENGKFVANKEGIYVVKAHKDSTETTDYVDATYEVVVTKLIQDKDEVEGIEVKLTGKTEKYEFTSYADKNGANQWATGKVQVVEKTENYIKVKVLENSIEGFVDNEYYVSPSTKIGNIVELKSDAELQTSLETPVFVKITKDVSEYTFASFDPTHETQYATGKVQVSDIVSTKKTWGCESIARAFKDATFLIPETSGAPYNYMVGTKPQTSEEYTFDIDKFTLKLVDPNDNSKVILTDKVVENTNKGQYFEYIYDEATWNDSYANGILKDYYVWADSIQPYKEDLWAEADNHGAAWNEIVKENGSPKEFEDGYHYVDSQGNPCVRCWKGALASAEAHWPWIAIKFNVNLGGFPVFEYEGKESNLPWGLKSFGVNYLVPVKVIENSVEGWTNKEFYIVSNAEIGDNFYKLYHKLS